MINKKSQEHSRNLLFFWFHGTLVGQKFITHWSPSEQFLAVCPENIDFPKKIV